MDLPAHIRSFDPENVLESIDLAAKAWGVKPATVKTWLYGERTPRPATAREIVKLDPRVTMEDIYRGARK